MGIRKSLVKTKRNITDWVKAESVRYFGDILRVDLPDGFLKGNVNLCLLAHYSSDGECAGYLFHYIESLKQAGCDVLVVSSAPDFAESARIKLLSLGVGLILRRNVGYDFGSWRAGLKVIPAAKQLYRTVIFANDSVYGPFSDLGVIIESMENQGLDVWALTESMERCPHLQTYFWAISNKGLTDGFFDYFWFEYYRYYSVRQRVIDLYELRIRKIAEERFSLKTGAYINADELMKSQGGGVDFSKINPTQHFALQLVREFDFPFVKRELLLNNPFDLRVENSLDGFLNSKNRPLWDLAKEHVAHLQRMN